MQQQELELRRVRKAIGPAIITFLAMRLSTGRVEFKADDLRRAVASVHPTAPASADRILRSLRQSGDIDYELVSRSESRYRVLSVGARKAA